MLGEHSSRKTFDDIGQNLSHRVGPIIMQQMMNMNERTPVDLSSRVHFRQQRESTPSYETFDDGLLRTSGSG